MPCPKHLPPEAATSLKARLQGSFGTVLKLFLSRQYISGGWWMVTWMYWAGKGHFQTAEVLTQYPTWSTAGVGPGLTLPYGRAGPVDWVQLSHQPYGRNPCCDSSSMIHNHYLCRSGTSHLAAAICKSKEKRGPKSSKTRPPVMLTSQSTIVTKARLSDWRWSI